MLEFYRSEPSAQTETLRETLTHLEETNDLVREQQERIQKLENEIIELRTRCDAPFTFDRRYNTAKSFTSSARKAIEKDTVATSSEKPLAKEKPSARAPSPHSANQAETISSVAENPERPPSPSGQQRKGKKNKTKKPPKANKNGKKSRHSSSSSDSSSSSGDSDASISTAELEPGVPLSEQSTSRLESLYHGYSSDQRGLNEMLAQMPPVAGQKLRRPPESVGRPEL